MCFLTFEDCFFYEIYYPLVLPQNVLMIENHPFMTELLESTDKLNVENNDVPWLITRDKYIGILVYLCPVFSMHICISLMYTHSTCAFIITPYMYDVYFHAI